MFYILIPLGAHDLVNMRFFGTYAWLETVMLRRARERITEGLHPKWCYAIGYDGDEELHPRFIFEITSAGILQRLDY